MTRRYRKKSSALNLFLTLFLLLLIGILCYKIYTEQIKPKYIDKKDTKENKEKINDKSNNIEDKNKETTKENKTEKKEETSGPMPTEEEETKKERDKNITINIELIGEDEVTVNRGSKYVDQGVKATDSDGNDMTDELEVVNNVDTSKVGKYSVVYSYGKNIVIRKVIVK